MSWSAQMKKIFPQIMKFVGVSTSARPANSLSYLGRSARVPWLSLVQDMMTKGNKQWHLVIAMRKGADKISADINLYDVTNTLPDCFNAREYEHLNLSDGTKYATMRANNRTIKFVAKPVSDYAGCHVLTIQK